MTQDDALPTMGNVTDSSVPLLAPGGAPDPLPNDVDAAAVAAARGAGVTVEEIVDLAGLEAVSRLYASIWRSDGNPPMTTELLRAFAKAGNYIAGAYDGTELVGACVGFFAEPSSGALHSHIAGVSPTMRGRAVGFALKVHQRAWALSRGVGTIAWTFDPLVSRNAWFNLGKLGADAVEYLPNFYGGMRDGINGDDDSDRLLVHWDLRADRVATAAHGVPRTVDATAARTGGAVVALGASALGAPVPGRLDGAVSLVAVPPDIEALRARDPGAATAWRLALRQALLPLLESGSCIAGFDRTGWYVLRRPAPGQQPEGVAQ